MTAVIECSGLTKFYGKNRGISDLTLSVDKGETFGFLGPNGAGKTTTIRCLLGMLKASSGEARVLGERVTLDGAKLRKRIGYVAGEVHLYDRETGQWHLDYVAGFRGGKRLLEKELIERFEYDPSRKVKELSKGNKQKLALIIGMAHDPGLLVLDEPTSGLDPLNQQTVFEVVEERVRAGATVFLSSHILTEVERLCERVAIVREGTLVAEESVAGLLSRRMRDVEVTFGEEVPLSLLSEIPGVKTAEQPSPTMLRATIKGGDMNALLAALASHPVRDLQITHASLEDVFMEFYRDGEPEGGEQS
ncbi:MAG: ABC transporter ATP-binding protein [Actinomycetota bacterium]|nr:MAG: antibiotic transport system ATP-binding [Actinomycetota bacterium]MDO8950359.1 ABC transporter ATP-binding protein [Actinomycetota bacterium]MDP3629404.1 ABC transporter ATP-binding protein [Actinomycetota bacterium]